MGVKLSFENGVLRKLFWSERDKVTGEWRKLCNKEVFISASHQVLFG